ncbi:MAG: 30S ribosome-binding factor RbfA [Actinomycetota bacterium]
MRSQRVIKVQKLAREVLGELIQNLKDPRVGFVTVTAVRVTADLRHARVLVSVLGSASDQESTMAGLRSATPVLRTEMGHEMRMKYTPELVFELDTRTDEALRVEELLNRIHQDRDAGEEPE